MKLIITIIPLFLCLTLLSCADLDGFLFNAEEIESYQLPDNNIPDSLIREITFDSDGNTLYGYWVSSNGKRPGITLLYCHGNKHNIDNYWDRVMFLHQLGVNVFIFDYRGYGRSAGESSEEGLYADGIAALDYLLTRNDVNQDSLVFYGYSLGNVVSIYLSAKEFDPLTLVAEAPFASANSLTQGSLLLDIPPLWLTEGGFDNAGRIKNITTPFLLLHGEEDDLVRYRDNGRVVFSNAPNPKKLILVAGAMHTDIPEVLGVDNYLSKLTEWIDGL